MGIVDISDLVAISQGENQTRLPLPYFLIAKDFYLFDPHVNPAASYGESAHYCRSKTLWLLPLISFSHF